MATTRGLFFRQKPTAKGFDRGHPSSTPPDSPLGVTELPKHELRLSDDSTTMSSTDNIISVNNMEDHAVNDSQVVADNRSEKNSERRGMDSHSKVDATTCRRRRHHPELDELTYQQAIGASLEVPWHDDDDDAPAANNTAQAVETNQHNSALRNVMVEDLGHMEGWDHHPQQQPPQQQQGDSIIRCHPEFAQLQQEIHDESIRYVQETTTTMMTKSSSSSSKEHDDHGDDDDDEVESFVARLSQQQLLELTISTLKAQLETVEERYCFIARIQALETLLEEQRKEVNAHVQRQIKLQKKHAKAKKKLLAQIDMLQQQLQEHQETIEKLQDERNVSHQQQTVPRLDDGRSIHDCLSPHVPPCECDDAAAVHLTVVEHLRMIIEELEDERHGFMTDIHTLGARIEELKEERKARELKISVLEDQLEVMEKQLNVMDNVAAVKDDGPSTSCHE
jgi:hypothetical protein